MNLTIIVPTYNAESFIQTTIDKLLLNFDGSEIIVVNDGSKDKTSEKIKKYQDRIKIVEHSINQGKGKALRNGFQVSTKDIIIFTDADLPYGIDNIRKIYDNLINDKCDVAIGYRQNFKENFWRHLTHVGINVIIQFLFWLNIYDTQCGLKGFKKSFIEKVQPVLISDNFTIDIELLYLAKILKQRIMKVLVSIENEKNISTIKIKDIMIMLMEILKIRFNKNYFKK